MKSDTFFIAFIMLSIIACGGAQEKKLADVEKQELAKKIRHDSIFMGIYLGMPAPNFFDHCWKMNKEGVFMEGSSKSVEYHLPKEGFNYLIQMNFYPRFNKNDRLNEMPVRFTYKALDPWNPNMQTDKLLKEVMKLLKKWYGEDFFLTSLPSGKKGYAKVDGNKRILVFVEKDFEVMVVFTDLMSIYY